MRRGRIDIQQKGLAVWEGRMCRETYGDLKGERDEGRSREDVQTIGQDA